MKKYTFLIMFLFYFGLINVEAANNLMQCDYTLHFGEPSYYIKYRVILNDDGTIEQTMPQNQQEEYTGPDGTEKFFPTLFNSENNNPIMSAPMTSSGFNASIMEDYYNNGENSSCPYLYLTTTQQTSYSIMPVDDTSLNTGQGMYVVEGTLSLFNENEEPVEEEKPEMTMVCSYPGVTIDNVPSVNIEFQMYNNGEKYFKFYFTERGENSAQTAKVIDGQDAKINTYKDNGDDYTIYLPSNEIENVFLQNSEQKSNNTFTCPDKGKIWLIEEAGIQAGYYKISTDAEEASEYSYTTDFNNGNVNINIDLPWGGTDCDSLLGSGAKGTPMYYIEFAFNLIKYLAIIMLFVFSIIEYAKAVASSDEKAIKKATTNTIKRLIIAVIIFFAPILISFLFRVLGIASDPSCGL